jgi:hypothetical protein
MSGLTRFFFFFFYLPISFENERIIFIGQLELNLFEDGHYFQYVDQINDL